MSNNNNNELCLTTTSKNPEELAKLNQTNNIITLTNETKLNSKVNYENIIYIQNNEEEVTGDFFYPPESHTEKLCNPNFQINEDPFKKINGKQFFMLNNII